MKRKAPAKTTPTRKAKPRVAPRSTTPKRAAIKRPVRRAGLEIVKAKEGYMIHDPAKDRVHYLNHTAVVVLELCDGETSPTRIAEMLRHAYGLPKAPRKDVERTLAQLKREGLAR